MLKCQIKHKKRVIITTAASLLTVGLLAVLVVVMAETPSDDKPLKIKANTESQIVLDVAEFDEKKLNETVFLMNQETTTTKTTINWFTTLTRLNFQVNIKCQPGWIYLAKIDQCIRQMESVLNLKESHEKCAQFNSRLIRLGEVDALIEASILQSNKSAGYWLDAEWDNQDRLFRDVNGNKLASSGVNYTV